MKRISLITLLFVTSLLLIAQNNQKVCKLGFTFQISTNLSWGLDEPVVTDVVPGSPADAAGLKTNDIILEVNGKGTYLKPAQTVMSWFAEDEKSVSISVRNLMSTFKQLNFEKDCRLTNAINEMQLAPVFAYYSLEDVHDREFIIPVKTFQNTDADFFNYRTYDFSSDKSHNEGLDKRINALFNRLFSQMGLKQDKEDPDFIIQTFYNYQNNPLFKPETFDPDQYQSNWRYDMRNNIMVKIPVYDPTLPVRTNDVMYNLDFGFRFFDRKFIEPGKSVLIYESEVNEKFSSTYDFLEYLEMNLPLILLKYPFSRNKTYGKYHVKFARINYTGISYDMNDLKTIIDVKPGSPADLAGILPGDIVLKVQNISFAHSVKNLTGNYKRFIAETMQFRDKKTRFTDSGGFKDAMYWDVSHYYNVSKSIENQRRYSSGFSYLFAFNQYIDWNWTGKLYFEVQRNAEIMNIEVKPDIRRDVQIYVE